MHNIHLMKNTIIYCMDMILLLFMNLINFKLYLGENKLLYLSQILIGILCFMSIRLKELLSQ
jgi:hypothetical protein